LNPLSVDSGGPISLRLQAAIYRESLALVSAGIADADDVDRVIKNSIGRRWAVGGPFEIWEQIGWDLVHVIAGELFSEISVAKSADEFSMDSLNEDSPAESSDSVSESEFENVAVIGAGLLGHGIALEMASRGKQVYLNDISGDLLADAMTKVRVGLEALASVGRIDEREISESISRITTSTDLTASVAGADLVIEAATENLGLKKSIFAAIDDAAPSDAVLASNSSTFVPSAYGFGVSDRSRVVGIHYFNPPHLLPGVEIINGPETSDETVQRIKREYERIGKQPAVVRAEIQGFVSNRLQVALLRESMAVVQARWITPSEVDELVRDGFGAELAKRGIFEYVAEHEAASFESKLSGLFSDLNNSRKLPKLLLDKIESGELGVKVGKGFYEWTPESAEAWRANMANSLLHMD